MCSLILVTRVCDPFWLNHHLCLECIPCSRPAQDVSLLHNQHFSSHVSCVHIFYSPECVPFCFRNTTCALNVSCVLVFCRPAQEPRMCAISLQHQHSALNVYFPHTFSSPEESTSLPRMYPVSSSLRPPQKPRFFIIHNRCTHHSLECLPSRRLRREEEKKREGGRNEKMRERAEGEGWRAVG